MTRLILAEQGLTGTAPAQLAELTGLRFLWLHSNALTGAVPAELGSLSNLEQLLLNDNMLSGSIPMELGELADTLEELYVANNGFTGCVPPSLRGVARHDLDRLGLPDCGG